jgi:hypothetical protein
MTELLLKPASGWVDGCEYGDPPKMTDRHYVVLCIDGPLDSQYETFHGEAPGYFYAPKAGAYQRIHEDQNGNDAVFVWRGRSYQHWWDRLAARWRGEPNCRANDRRMNDDTGAYMRSQRIRLDTPRDLS